MIRIFKVAMSPDLVTPDSPVLATLASGYIGQGPKVDAFEDALQAEFALKTRPVTTNSCTSALDLALELIGVGPGDAVVTTPQTCTATNTPIVKRGAIPVWADVNTRGLVTPVSVRAAADSVKGWRTVKAIMVVDWAGARPDIAGIRKFVPGLPIIEDAAHRLPGESDADYAAFSFQAIKFLTTGDGGALLTPFNQIQRAKLLRWYGLDREGSASFRCEQNIEEVGFKYHMNDIAATIGLANLPVAVANLEKQRANARYLADALRVDYDEDSHYWFFPLTVKDRASFTAHMEEQGVETSQVHARNDKHTGFQYPRPLPGVDWFDAHQIAIPCGWWLEQSELDHIVQAVLSA
jgi:perosamine synthetase